MLQATFPLAMLMYHNIVVKVLLLLLKAQTCFDLQLDDFTAYTARTTNAKNIRSTIPSENLGCAQFRIIIMLPIATVQGLFQYL